MKLLKNRGRKNKIIIKLREQLIAQIELYDKMYFGIRRDMDFNRDYRMSSEAELEALRNENNDLLNMKDKYIKLLAAIKINEQK